jgi:hypothetical protein
MPQENPYVTMQKNGKVFDIPRENLLKAKALGWREVQDLGKKISTENGAVDENSFIQNLRASMGMSPKGTFTEDIKDIGSGFKQMATHPIESGKMLGGSMLEAQEGTGGRALAELKDPNWMKKAHGLIREIYAGLPLVGPILERAGTQFEQGHWKGGMGTMTPVLAGEAGKAPIVQDAALRATEAAKALPGQAAEGAGKAVKTTVRSIADRDPAAVREAAGKVGEREAASAEIAKSNAKIEAARNTIEQTKQQASKKLTDNLNRTIDTIKTAFDAEYGDFDAKVLGKTKENPKGTLQADISPVAEAVQNAKKNIVEGTEESIKQFDSIMGRIGKDRIDVGGGELAPVPNQMIPAADLRGYITELQGKIYDSKLLPDVRNAAKSVVEAGQKELTNTIKKQFGPQVVELYKDLNARYSDYLTDWRDTSKVNPLPRIRNMLLEGVVQKNPNVLADLDVAKLLKGDKGKTALSLLEKYKKFGADPEILNQYRGAIEKLDALPKPKTVPQVKPFNAEEFVKEGVARRMRTMGHWGTGMAIVSFLLDVLHGNAGAMMTAAERVAAVQILKGYLTGEKFLNWVAKETPTKAKEGTI